MYLNISWHVSQYQMSAGMYVSQYHVSWHVSDTLYLDHRHSPLPQIASLLNIFELGPDVL